MYCVKCGVELADTEKVCPLCGTRVCHPDFVQPDAEPTFPAEKNEEVRVNRKGVLFAVMLAFAAAIAQLLICAFSFPSTSAWAGYAIGGVLLIYIIVVLPLWFKRPNPVIFVPCDYAAVLLYVLYICITLKGKWFMSFAFPVIGLNGLLVTAVVALIYYLRRGYLYIIGGALIAHGGFMVLLEFLIGITFLHDGTLRWSYFPLAACFILGMGLIVIAIVKPLRESLRKKLFF